MSGPMLSYNVADLLRSAPGTSERHDVAVATLPIADAVELVDPVTGHVRLTNTGRSILVQGIPASLKNWNEGQLLLDMLDDLALDDRPSQEDQVDLLASYACHGAVRAGEPLTVPEMQNLVDQLFATDTPLSCPHGRPTLIQFSLQELEKRFGRS